MRCLRLIISLWIVGFTEQVVDADIVESGKFDKNLSWNVVCTYLIFRISGLRHA